MVESFGMGCTGARQQPFSNRFPGGLRNWYPCLVLLILDCFRDARNNGGEHTSAENVAAAAAGPTPAARPVHRGFDVRDDSDDDEPVRRPPAHAPAPVPARLPDDQLSIEQLLARDIGGNMAGNVMLMLSSMDTYYVMHNTIRTPPAGVDVPASPARSE